MARSLTLATRKSMLALAQARAWVNTLKAQHTDLEVTELHVVTTGDKITDRPLQEVGGKGLFLKEIEEALLAKEAHFAVHSIKDVPADLAPGLVLAAIPIREDARDVLVSRDGKKLAELPAGSKIGTSSLRRSVLLRKARPDLQFVPLRGNVDTRLRKVQAGECDAIVLAAAGLRRLGLIDRATEILSVQISIPAVGQGALGIECRADDSSTFDILRVTHHKDTALMVACERGVMRAVEGSCQIPIAAHAQIDNGSMLVNTMLADADGSNPRFLEERFSLPTSEEESAKIGEELGKKLKSQLTRVGFPAKMPFIGIIGNNSKCYLGARISKTPS